LQEPTGGAHPCCVQRAVTVVPAKPAAVLQIPIHLSPMRGAVHCCVASHLACGTAGGGRWQPACSSNTARSVSAHQATA
jgi:hypothetical protein